MRCMMYDIIVFENDKPEFSKKPTLVTIFGNLFFFFLFFSSGGGGRGGEGSGKRSLWDVRVYTRHLNIDCGDVATIGGLKQ